jgi:hypothetical protein
MSWDYQDTFLLVQRPEIRRLIYLFFYNFY